MKKIALVLALLLVTALCSACGPYVDYAGTYTRSDSQATWTVTMDASGSFKFERKFKVSNPYNPNDNDNDNIRKGTYTVEDGKITISFSYYDKIERRTISETATAELKGDTLTISGSEIGGKYKKR